MSNGKNMTILLIVGLIKNTLYKMSQYFPPYRNFGRNVKVELDFSTYARKAGLRNVKHVISNFAMKSNLASLKTDVDKVDVYKFKIVPVVLSKLSNVVKNDVSKKTGYDKLVTKVNNSDNTTFFKKAKYNTDKSDFEKKISDSEKRFLIQADLLIKQI